MPAFIEARFWFTVLVLVAAAVLLLTYGKLKGRWLLFAHVTLLFTVNVAFYAQRKLAQAGHLDSLTKDTLDNISIALMSVGIFATLLLVAYVIAIQPRSEKVVSAQQEVSPPMTAQGESPPPSPSKPSGLKFAYAVVLQVLWLASFVVFAAGIAKLYHVVIFGVLAAINWKVIWEYTRK